MADIKYIKCPRCELNFIPSTEMLCKVCKQELDRVGTTDIMEEDLIICPICKSAFITVDEDMCPSCLQEKGIDDFIVNDDDKTDNWRAYVENDDEDLDLENDEMNELHDIEKEGLLGPDIDIEEDLDQEFESELAQEFKDEFDDDFYDDEEDDLDDLDDDFDEDFEDIEDDFDDEDLED